MEKLRAHHVRLTTFIQATEDEDKVLDAIATFIPEETDEDDLIFDVVETEGYFGNPIKVVNVEIQKSRAVRQFLDYFKELLSEEDKRYILENLEENVDEEGTLYVRFNKQKAYLGDVEIDEGADVIQVRIKVKAFPMRKEAVVKAIREWLEE
ncbi:RNA-binding protein [Thermococcus waiotapuensis]|uniref:RNA-binding protein n=1 Tax=Thermococcus waiotapuensis TaxID=90909 RepID=A0AAE4NTA0_9EURY|nr:RNA-binding protein [Thermococcus waiotapuensis]MDV3103240.1 RNA-binding protein [Thermococcus waiotapuensis]